MFVPTFLIVMFRAPAPGRTARDSFRMRRAIPAMFALGSLVACECGISLGGGAY
jgi:hypothetical protein